MIYTNDPTKIAVYVIQIKATLNNGDFSVANVHIDITHPCSTATFSTFSINNSPYTYDVRSNTVMNTISLGWTYSQPGCSETITYDVTDGVFNPVSGTFSIGSTHV